MRKITQNAANAFVAGSKFTDGNTHVDSYTADGVQQSRMYLHGNEIAYRNGNELLLTLAGWPTVTTRERLNGLLQTYGKGRDFFQQDYQQYFRTTKIDDRQWIKLTLA